MLGWVLFAMGMFVVVLVGIENHSLRRKLQINRKLRKDLKEEMERRSTFDSKMINNLLTGRHRLPANLIKRKR